MRQITSYTDFLAESINKSANYVEYIANEVNDLQNMAATKKLTNDLLSIRAVQEKMNAIKARKQMEDLGWIDEFREKYKENIEIDEEKVQKLQADSNFQRTKTSSKLGKVKFHIQQITKDL